MFPETNMKDYLLDVKKQKANFFQSFFLSFQAICLVLSAVCIFLSMVASVFTGIQGHRISGFSECQMNVTNSVSTCHCYTESPDEQDPDDRIFQYKSIQSCSIVQTSIKDYLILQCALCGIASGVCFWFVTLLWKGRYEDFHSGLRFYSYSANVPPHPWSNPSNPPYLKNPDRATSPVTVRKASTRSRRSQFSSAESQLDSSPDTEDPPQPTSSRCVLDGPDHVGHQLMADSIQDFDPTDEVQQVIFYSSQEYSWIKGFQSFNMFNSIQGFCNLQLKTVIKTVNENGSEVLPSCSCNVRTTHDIKVVLL